MHAQLVIQVMDDSGTQVEKDMMFLFMDSTSIQRTSQALEPHRSTVHRVLRKLLPFSSYKLFLLQVILHAYCNAQETFALEMFDRCELQYE